MKGKFIGLWLRDLSIRFLSKELDHFNSVVFIFQSIIRILVGIILIIITLNIKWHSQLSHWILLEVLWTLSPVRVLVFLGFPSLKNLYQIESFFDNNINLKVIGHQWYWEYSIPELSIISDCYPLRKASLYRIGESDTLILPFICKIRRLITSQDVIHSWCLPSLGFKVDACPGRLNYFMLRSLVRRFIIGQCSELCGTYHSWIPIKLEFTSVGLFIFNLKIT